MYFGLHWENILRHFVLVLTGIELIFSIVPGTLLCSGFRMTTILITHWYFSCWQAVFTLKEGLFSVPCPAKGQAQETGEQLTWTGQREIPHHALCINWEGLAGNCGLLLGDQLGIGQLMESNCIVHHIFLWFILLSHFPMMMIMLYFISVRKQFLSQHMVFTFYFDSPHHPTRSKGTSEQLRGISNLNPKHEPGAHPSHDGFIQLCVGHFV